MLASEIREQKSLFDVQTDEDADSQLEALREPKSLFDTEPQGEEKEMQTLGLCHDPRPNKGRGFWERQFQAEPTPRQKRWDWAFGVILPVVCIFFDPLVFRAVNGFDHAYLGTYRPFAYACSFVSIMLLVAWLLWREKLGALGAVFGGVFLVASAISLVVGVALLPLSLIGLIVLIGALGFTPLITSVIFFRNAVRALRSASIDLSASKLMAAATVGFLWGVAVPYSLQSEIDRSLELVKTGTPQTIRAQGLKLRLLAPLVDSSKVGDIYSRLPDNSPEKAEAGRLYRQLTGEGPKTENGFMMYLASSLR